jgi:hypothetical protein
MLQLIIKSPFTTYNNLHVQYIYHLWMLFQHTEPFNNSQATLSPSQWDQGKSRDISKFQGKILYRYVIGTTKSLEHTIPCIRVTEFLLYLTSEGENSF